MRCQRLCVRARLVPGINYAKEYDSFYPRPNSVPIKILAKLVPDLKHEAGTVRPARRAHQADAISSADDRRPPGGAGAGAPVATATIATPADAREISTLAGFDVCHKAACEPHAALSKDTTAITTDSSKHCSQADLHKAKTMPLSTLSTICKSRRSSWRQPSQP